MTQVSNARHTINPNESFGDLKSPDQNSEIAQRDRKVSFKAKATYFVKTYTVGVSQDGRLYIFHRGGNVYLDQASSKHLTSQKLLPQILCHDSTPTIIKVKTLAVSQSETRKEILSTFTTNALCDFCRVAIVSDQIQQFSGALKQIYTSSRSDFLDLLKALTEEERLELMSLPEIVVEAESINLSLPNSKQINLTEKVGHQEKQEALTQALVNSGDFVVKKSFESEASWSYLDVTMLSPSSSTNDEGVNCNQVSPDSQTLILSRFPELLLPTGSSGLSCNFGSAHQNAVISVYLSLPDSERKAFLSSLSDETLKAQLEYLFRSLNSTLEVKIDDGTLNAKVSTQEWKAQLLETFKQLPQQRQIVLFKCLDRELQVQLLNGLSSVEIDACFIKQLAVELSSDEIAQLISPESHNEVFGGNLSVLPLSEKVIESLIRSLSVPKATYLYCISPDYIESKIIEKNEEVIGRGFECIFDEVICFLMFLSEIRETNDKRKQVYSFEKVMKFVETGEFKAYSQSSYDSPDKLKFVFNKLEQVNKHASHSILQVWFKSDLDHFCQIYQCIDSEFLTESKRNYLELNSLMINFSINGCLCACRLLPLNYAQALYSKLLGSSETGLNEELIQATESLSKYPKFLPHNIELLSRLAKGLKGGAKLNSLLYLLFQAQPDFQNAVKVLSKEQWEDPVVVGYCIDELSDSAIQKLLVDIESSEICTVFISTVQPKTRQNKIYRYIAQHKPKFFLDLFSEGETVSRKELINAISPSHQQAVFTDGVKQSSDLKGALMFLLISDLNEEQMCAAFKAIEIEFSDNLIKQISQLELSETEVDVLMLFISKLHEEGLNNALPIDVCHYLLSIRPKQAATLIFDKLAMNVTELMRGYKGGNYETIFKTIFESFGSYDELKRTNLLGTFLSQVCELESTPDSVIVLVFEGMQHKERLEIIIKHPKIIKRLDRPQLHKSLSALVIAGEDITEAEDASREQKEFFNFSLDAKQFFVNLLLHADPKVIQYVEKDVDQIELMDQLLKIKFDRNSGKSISDFSYGFLNDLLNRALEKENLEFIALVFSEKHKRSVSSSRIYRQAEIRLLQYTILPEFMRLNPNQSLTLFVLLSKELQLALLNFKENRMIVAKIQSLVEEAELSPQPINLESEVPDLRGTLRSRTGSMAQGYIAWTINRKGVRKTDRSEQEHTPDTKMVINALEKLDLEISTKFLSIVTPSVCKKILSAMSQECAIKIVSSLPEESDEIRVPYCFAVEGNKHVVKEVVKWANAIRTNISDVTGDYDAESDDLKGYEAITEYSCLLAEVVPGLSDEVLFGIINQYPELAWILFPIKFESFNILQLQKHLEFSLIEKVVSNTPESLQTAILDADHQGTYIEVIPKLSGNVLALLTCVYRDNEEVFNKLCNACPPDKRAELVASGEPSLLLQYNAFFSEDVVMEFLLAEVKKEEVERFLLHIIRAKIGLAALAKRLDDQSFDLQNVFALFSKLKKNDTSRLFKLITNDERKEQLRKTLKK
ncbi:hypothetical protein JQC92_07875 [Shewanella sp. 202IG2-18]|uniref:hypothetical protein n=1 Tax=Parashewanella hymeniacidonis TaxID=2807618 RepID=UPI00195F3F6F|nr:hypothetical protein [Parashewanella hymeniacidonis]MBM7071955.1 hypothetical protein [Parashewanella hymeniacidonis]